MKYQLVLQSSASSVEDYDLMIDVENELVDRLSAHHDVDGHDAGSGEMNIFVLTDDPKLAFTELKPILDARELLGTVRVAYRELKGTAYTVLWPQGLNVFKVT
jgi:hypothetical protein